MMSGEDDRRETASDLASDTRSNSFVNFFKLPAPVRRVFDRFPLLTYPPNELPSLTLRKDASHILHVFSTAERCSDGLPSFNPSCLKWQAYLRFCGIEFEMVISNNHASPTGVLPFLTPSDSPSTSSISSNMIKKWALSQTPKKAGEEPEWTPDHEAFLSLIDNEIRRAWLYNLYLKKMNAESVAKALYIHPASSNMFVQGWTFYQLQQAALMELQRKHERVEERDLYRDAREAFKALSTLLGDNDHFFGEQKPALFDASLFAYTHLLLDCSLNWRDMQLTDELRKWPNLVSHRERILVKYFGSDATAKSSPS